MDILRAVQRSKHLRSETVAHAPDSPPTHPRDGVVRKVVIEADCLQRLEPSVA